MHKELVYLLNFIKLGYKNKYSFIILKYLNNISIKFLTLFYKKGLIQNYELLPNKKIKIELKFIDNKSVINKLKLVSTPTRKISLRFNLLFYSSNKKKTHGLLSIKKKSKYKYSNKKLKNFDLNLLYNLKTLNLILNLKSKNVISFNNKLNSLNYIKKKKFLINKLNYQFQLNKKMILNKKILYNNKFKFIKKNYYINNTLKNYSNLNKSNGTLFLSTSKGFMDHTEAYHQHLGGELICKIN